MATILCVIFMILALASISLSSGFMAAIFVILSVIAYVNHAGGKGSGPDDQRMA